MLRIEELKARLDLQEHPEGGYFKETYRSHGTIRKEALPPGFSGDRNYATSIYFLLTSTNFSAFHRIRQDEIWHFYEGSPIALHVLKPDGCYQEVILGSDISEGQCFQHVVEAGDWFASEVIGPETYSLAGCTVAPGFDFEDFEMASKQQLVTKYPAYEGLISRLTRF